MESTGAPSSSMESRTGVNIPSADSSTLPCPRPFASLVSEQVVEPQELHDLSPEENIQGSSAHGLSKTTIEKSWRIVFRLLQRSDALNCYILEMHEVEGEKTRRFQSTVHSNKVNTRVLSMNEPITTRPTVQICNNINLQPRSKIPLNKRLGNWVVEQRKFNESERRDKYYIHTIMGKKFRSINEVATFILCNVFIEDLRME
ncbi:uncharacterized protein LOC127242475 [Andrographis paniculata]|uniref:uncharacterized protein LOC127242475 n=1 Tax=Andrographis paniculata TaxID=175694 RepID=UPI0021E8B077|nr:uncharacterized protein LOC127242475 [Andrographis paniculata]